MIRLVYRAIHFLFNVIQCIDLKKKTIIRTYHWKNTDRIVSYCSTLDQWQYLTPAFEF